ncbi:Nodulin-related protein [Actinidia chinensis var. chinensis]|uniref:Nodulin-related protein n=1 Tax=Actinidia chinensis var. chinensis TaxID=1590841 RepID=A0A2R6PBP9_ACTCC|nr:Nodulin-related protein [Actinidia chinensis var. chinensis]
MDPTPDHKTGEGHHRQPPSTSELFSSAKLVADAAFGKGSETVDKDKVAGAAEDLLNAASHYGKLEEKGYGTYVEKAESYLHQYNSSHSPTPTAAAGGATTHASPKPDGDDEKSADGYGDYFKMAEGFLKKH